METVCITAFYKFLQLSEQDIENLRDTFETYAAGQGMRGLLIMAPEGINATVSGSPEAIAGFKELLQTHIGDVTCKDSAAESQPYTRWSIKVREEIVTLHDTNITPDSPENNHITPEQWHQMMQEDDVLILDTRNTYETEIGMFRNAVDPGLKHFKHFPEYLRKAKIPKDKKVLMYCTGGIRCDKAMVAMQKEGYEHVYQLKGGILKYLEEYPDGLFDGECFVFDHRTAVDANLEPSKRYALCPHCGDPGDVCIRCSNCLEQGRICFRCEKKELLTCSKACQSCLQQLCKS